MNLAWGIVAIGLIGAGTVLCEQSVWWILASLAGGVIIGWICAKADRAERQRHG